MTALEALATIQREMQARNAEAVPDGWLTVEQWAKGWSMACSHTRELLRNAVSKEIMETRKFKVATGAGVRAVNHYRLVPKKRK